MPEKTRAENRRTREAEADARNDITRTRTLIDEVLTDMTVLSADLHRLFRELGEPQQ